MKKILIFFFLFISFINHSQNFELVGEFKGSNTNDIVLKYQSLDNQYISDTLVIKNGKFRADGKINGIQKVLLIGNISTKSFEDPNLGYFFLEPGKVKIKLEEDNFKNLIVANSPTHTEFEKVNRRSLKIRPSIDSLIQVNADRDLINQKFEEIKDLELAYAKDNPTSPLSSYYVNFYQSQIPMDSLRQYYQQMSKENKHSVYGVAIKDLIDKKIVDKNDVAPNFDLIDLAGEKISLENFKGKYLLMDFWAAWCGPCLKQLPEVKSLYRKYGTKGLEVLGVSFDKNQEEWRKSVSRHGTQDWNHVFVGLKNVRDKGSISEKYDIRPIPAYILIDRDGKIIGRYGSASNQDKSFKDLALELEEIFSKK